MVFSFSCCGKSSKENSAAAQSSSASSAVSGSAAKAKDNASLKNVNITLTPAEELSQTLKEYADPNGCFTAMIPEGWEVSTAGYDMMYWIRIYDPVNLNLQVFTLLKTECLLSNSASKQFYENLRGLDLYSMFADMIVCEKVDDFYTQFMDFCAFMATYEQTYHGFEYPQISSFETIEKFPLNSSFSSYAIDDSVIHGKFTNTLSQESGEGMFTGSLVHGFDYQGYGCNMMYNINAATANYGQYSEYEELLSTILSSVSYTDTFVQTVLTDTSIKAAGASALNSTLQQTTDIITDGWYSREKTYDIISEKYSDATLGYERVYDVETGDIYKAYNGFTDISGIDEYYLPVTDDMYSSPVAGYIER